jgi:hypothetical protein
MSPADVAAGVRLLRSVRGDTKGFITSMAQRLGLTIGEPKTETEESEPFPEADLVSKDGQLKTYRAETLQKILDIHTKNVTRQVMNQLSPYLQYVDGAADRDEFLSQQEARRAALAEEIQSVRESPHFDEAGVLAALRAIPEDERRRLGQIKSLRKAYTTYVKETVLPGIDAAAEKRIREANLKKLAASDGSISPTTPSGNGKPQPLRDGDVGALARRMEEMAAAASS